MINYDIKFKCDYLFAKVEATMKKYAFNRWASDKMSLKRQLPDVRHATCRTIQYDNDLPKVSELTGDQMLPGVYQVLPNGDQVLSGVTR